MIQPEIVHLEMIQSGMIQSEIVQLEIVHLETIRKSPGRAASVANPLELKKRSLNGLALGGRKENPCPLGLHRFDRHTLP